jgi:acyl carrier protein
MSVRKSGVFMSDPLVETVVSALAEVKHVPPERITLETTLADLGMDSLDTVTMLFELETRLQISIPDEAAKSVRTVRDVVDGIRGLAASPAAQSMPSAS